MIGIVELEEKISFYDQPKLIQFFFNLGKRLNGSGKSEAAARERAS